MKELLTLLILIGESHMLTTPDSTTINMVEFGGKGYGPLFQGDILPGGVDVQRYDADGAHLSARYMLEGRDSLGQACRVYIDNRVSPEMAKGTTRPTVMTDSRFLQERLAGRLVGTMGWDEEGLKIRIFRDASPEE